MKNSTLEILKCGINLSGEHNKDFTEVDLASASTLQIKNILEIIQSDELKPFLHLTRKSKIDCPKCGSKIDADNSLEYCFCSECSEEINLNNCPLYTIGINQERVQEYLVDFLLNEFEKSGWKNRDSDENFFVIKKADKLIALSLCTSGNGLKDYFALRGWAIDYDPQSYVIISQNFDKFISSYSDKDLKCVLITLTEIFKDNFISGMLEEISKRVDVYQKEQEAEKVVNIEFRKFGDLSKLIEHYEDLLRFLPSRALQKTDESVPQQGKKFEKDIVKILNLTILRTKYAGGGNEPDGIGIVNKYGKEKTVWFPMEIKTFTPSDDSRPLYPLKEVTRQIDKYLNAMESEEITRIVEVPAFIAIAYDFDLEGKDEKDLLETFQTKHNKRLILFPLKSILKIFKLFCENNIFSLPSDLIQKWLLKNNYITEENVEELFKELVKHNAEQFNDQMKIVRKKTKVQGK